MNDIMTELYVRGSKIKKRNVPKGKQNEENTTNKPIECVQCSRMKNDIIARVVRVVGSNGNIIGSCCYSCSQTTRFNGNILLLLNDDNKWLEEIYNPHSVGNSQLPRGIGYNIGDPTFNQFKDRDKFVKQVRNMRAINKRLGVMQPTFQQERKNKIREATKPILERISPQQRQELIDMFKRGEIKID